MLCERLFLFWSNQNNCYLKLIAKREIFSKENILRNTLLGFLRLQQITTTRNEFHNHAQNVKTWTKARLSFSGGGRSECQSKKKQSKWHFGNTCCAELRYISYTKFFEQILEVLQDFHCLFGSRNSRTTDILHTIRHVYRSVWPAREAKPRFGAALERSAHDSVKLVYSSKARKHYIKMHKIIVYWYLHLELIHMMAALSGGQTTPRHMWTWSLDNTRI